MPNSRFSRQFQSALQKNLVKGLVRFSSHCACAGIRAGHNGATDEEVKKMAINHFGGGHTPARPWVDAALGSDMEGLAKFAADELRTILTAPTKSTSLSKEFTDSSWNKTSGGQLFVQEDGRGGWENALRKIANTIAAVQIISIEDGNRFQENEPSTLAKKEREGAQLTPLREWDKSLGSIHGWVE